MATNSGTMHFVMVPWLAFGHILPFTELARLIALQGHRVTLLSTPRNTRRLISIPPDLECLVRVVDVPLLRIERLPEDAEATIDLLSDDLRPCLRRAFDAAFSPKLSEILQAQEDSSTRPHWVLIDYAAYWAPAAAASHGVPCAFVSLFSAAALCFFGPPAALMGLGKHARTKLDDLTSVPNYVPFPTTVAYRGYELRAMFKPGMIPNESEVSEGHRIAKSIEESQIVGVRSSRAFEPEWLQLVGELYGKPVVPLGMFPPPPITHATVSGHEVALKWLDTQAPRSVVYVAFGSEVKLASAQQQAIALGLEASGMPFLWAYRAPADSDSDTGGGGLPEGFEERVNGQQGLVCRGWVPQVRFLAHGSVGGFLTQAGLNSITEGLANGVRLVLLPLLFDQGLNARLLVEKKIAVEVARDEEDGSFMAEDVAAALRRVMVEDEGEEFGAKVQELAEVIGSDEVNDQCVRDFLRCLSDYSRQQQG
ncbi:hypothetical protein HU200_002301 [Digitaria exilis]|uniref:Uncharacterized protein n=1 Tax=Digitaria exilis TaxID=1010633 RepID=A0A835KV85_9POAL|nr:hypothetical protein HU200_002301 [Digitaria exilis]